MVPYQGSSSMRRSLLGRKLVELGVAPSGRGRRGLLAQIRSMPCAMGATMRPIAGLALSRALDAGTVMKPGAPGSSTR